MPLEIQLNFYKVEEIERKNLLFDQENFYQNTQIKDKQESILLSCLKMRGWIFWRETGPHRETAVPVLPAMPSFAFSSRVISAVRPDLDSANFTAAWTLGSMEPGAN